MANKWNEKEQGAKRRRSNQGTRGTTQPAASNPNKNRKSTDTNRNSGRAAAKPAPKAAPKQTKPKTVYYSNKNKGSKGVAAGVKAATRAATNTATNKVGVKYPQTQALRTLSRQAGARNYVTGRDIPLAMNRPKTFQQTVTPLEQMKADAVAGPKYWGARAIVPSKKLTAEQQKKKNQQTAKQSGFNARARKQTLSSYDQKLSQGKQFQIQQAKQRYDEAKAKGDRAGMEKAHREAENLRYTAGYSGGATGNERIAPKLSQDDYNRLNASGRLAMTQAQMTRDRATTEDEIARADRRIEEILNAPGYQNRGRDINTARGMRETAEGRSTMLGATREQREQDAAGLKNATLAGLHLGAGGAGHWLEATDWTIANRNRDQNMAKWLQDADDYESARSDLEYYDNYVQTFGEPPAGMNRNVLQMRLNNATQAKAQLERMQTDPHSAYYDETVAQRLGMPTDTQSYWEKMIRQGQQEQLASQEGLSPAEKWINDLYISGIQTIPTTAAALIPGGQGGALAGLASAARGLALAGMGASAAGNRMTELQDAGQAFDQAYRNATVAGIIEAGTEMIGVEKLASAAAGKVPQNALRAILEQGLAEGGEEALSYALNTGYNKLADLPGQEWSWKDFASQAASGAVMGAVHMGAGVMINSLAASGAVSQERAQRSYQAWQASADQARSLLNDAKQWYIMMDQGAVSQEEAEAALSQVSQQINGQAEPVTREWLARQEELLDIEENAIRGAITRQEARDQQSQILDQVTAQSRDNEANRMAAEWDEEERQARAAQNAAVSARTRLDQRLEDWRWRQDEPVSVNPVEQAEQMTAEALRATDAEMARRDAVAQLQAETPPINYERSGLPPTSFLGAAIDARREARARAEAEAQVRRDQEIARQNRVAAETAPNAAPTVSQVSPNAETRQQVQQPGSRLEGLASTFGESGAASLRTIGGKMVTGQGAFVRDFTDVYNQVLGGRSESQVSRPAGMSDANYFAAVTAAQNDRKTGWDLDILKASKAAGRNVNAGVDWRDQYVRQMDRKTVRTVDGLAKALGVKVVFAEKGSILTAGGTAANAEITGNVVRIEKDNPNPVRMLIGHELTHRMQDVSPESYRAFRDYVMSRPGSMETLERTVARYQEAKAFRAEDNVRQMAMDEVTADAAGELLENSEQLKEFIRRNYENRTLLEVIRDFFRDLAAKLTGRQKAQADEAVRLLEEAIKGASARVKEAVKAENWNKKASKNSVKRNSLGDRIDNGLILSGSTASYTDERINTVLQEYGGGGNYAQGFVTYIDPNDFLKLTLSDTTRAKWEGGLDKGEFPEEFFPLDEEKLRGNRQSPYLRVDTATGEVLGHEGRHRMLALARAGINKAPVVLVDTATKYSKEPTAQMRLTSQDFGHGPVNDGYAVTVENLLPTNKQYRDQIKEAYGSENARVRFSLSAPVEETETLVALHNLDAEKIDRSLRLGAFPAPSIAIVKAKEGHSKFGPISIVFPRSTIDPEASRKNRVYGSDAWTPTHSNARVEYPVNYDALLRIEKQLEELSGQVAGGTFRGYSLLRRRGLDDDSSMDRKELAERLSGDDEVRAAYLAAQGRTLEPVMREKEFDAMGNDFLQTILDTVGEQEIAGMTAVLMEGGRLTEADKGTLREIWRQNWIKSLPKRIREKRSPESIEEKSRERAAELSDFKMEQFVRHTWDYYENHGVKGDEIDRIATSDKLRAAVNDADVAAWMEDQLDGLLGEPGVYNGKDPYTASGNKRSFATLHYPYTAEGIVRAMYESTSGSRGQNAWGVTANTLISVATPEYGSVDEIHADEDRLRQLPEEEYKALLAPIDAGITSFIQGVKKTNKAFAASDYEEGEIIASILMDNAGKKTAKGIQSGFRKEGYTLSPELAKSALEIFKQARAVPTGYFEAKPERVVGFDEVLAAVVPSDMDAGLRSRMEEAGMRLIDYERDNEQSRMDAVNSVEGARFSITPQADADAIGTHDSEGYSLTKGQREYFKDSQVTDERGRLLRVYHGTPVGGFTEFREANNPGYFFTRSRSLAQTYSGGGDEFAPERVETWEDAQSMARQYDLDLVEENGGWTLKHRWGEEHFGPNDLDEVADSILKEAEGEQMEYVGYLNLTNPLVVEGHGAYWNKISGVGAYGHRDRIELWEDLGKYHIRLFDEMDPEKLRDMEEIKASPEELREILTDYYAEETADRIIDDWIEAGFSPQDFELLSDADGHETRERTTLEWVWDAVDGGYDGVIFHNIIDEGRYGGADEVTDVYVALDSNQFKSVNNWNPTDNDDIRYSIGTEGYDRARLMRENQELKEKLDYWRSQVKKSDRTKADSKEVRKLAKSLRADYSTEMDAGEITQRLQAIYDGIGKDWTYDRAYEEAGKLARDMIEQATATEDYLYAEYEPMRKFFQDTPLVVTKEMQRAIPDYNEWRKPLFGKLRLQGGDKTNVDKVFQEAVEKWPEWFNEEVDNNSVDQLERIAEVMDSVYKREEFNPFEDDMSAPAGYLATAIMDMYWDIPAVKKTFADRAEARLGREVTRRLDMKERYENALQKVREQRDRKLREQSQRYLTAKKKRSKQQKERELRAKIQRHVNKLSTKLTRPTDTQHIPEALIDTVRTALESINLASKDMKDTKRTQAFAALQKMYQEMDTNGSEVVIDPDLLPNISDIIGFADTPIANLGLEDLNTIWQTIRAIEASISTFNKALGRAKFETISQPAFGIRDYLTGRKDRGDYRGPFRQMDKLLNFNMLTPEAYFLRLGNSGKEVFRMLRDAQDRHITIMDQAQRKTREIVGKTNIRKLEKEKHTFTFDGDTVELTTAQIMSLYELMKRQQAVDHVMIGGIRPESVKKGIKDLPPARPWHLTQDQVSVIVDSLTDEQVKLADELQQYMGGTMAELGNEASMEVYGYRKFTEKHYFPISVDKNQTQSDVKNDAVSGTIAGWGSARPVKPNANNAVILRSIFDVYADHTTEMANYASWLAPMENMNRIFNFRYKDAEGNQTGTMKDQLETLFGKNGEAYWKQLQNDLNNGVHGRDDSPFSAFMGTYKASAIGANIRVIAQQPTAILRAMDSINPADFVAGMARARWGKFDKVVKQYAPIAIWKDWGYFQQDTGRQMRNVLFNDDTKLQKANSAMMWGAGKADSLSWTAIWNALENETRRKRKDLRYKSREFYEAVAERFNEVVDHTQVVDGILQRSQIMRSADGLTKMATSFMAEPTKTYNMMLSAIYEARNAKGRERSAAMGKLAKTAFALTVSITVNAAAQSLVDAIRDDDKDEDYWEKFIQAYFGLEGDTRKEQIKNGILNGNLEAAFNPLTYIPYLKDIVSQTQGYSVSRMDMDTISRVLKAFTNVEKSMSGEGKNTKQSAWLNLTAEIARFLGVPAANIKRDIQTITRTFFAGTGNYRMLYAQEKFLYDVTSKNTLTEFSKLILGAERAGDDEAAQAIRQDMIDSGVDAEKIDKKLAELRKKAVTDTEEFQTALAQKTDAYQTMLEADARFNGLDEDKQENVRKRLNDYAQYQVLGQSMDVENDKMEKIADAESHKVPAADWVVFTAAADAIEADYKPDGTLIQGSKKKKVVALIDSYDVSNEGKSYMYLSQGYSEKDNPYQ